LQRIVEEGATKMDTSLVEVKNLKKYFKTPNGLLHAVDNISFSLKKGQTLGVVGESGCGKSTLGRTILRLIEPTEGEVLFKGESILGYDFHQMREIRKQMQIIFQDPYSSINPRMTVSDIIAEPVRVCKTITGEENIQKAVNEIMERVGLSNRLVNSYPHELDGGRRQRIGVARAIILNPEFIVCDEPVSALDVSIQAQILNLMMDLQEENGYSYMFITHDLSVVKHISDEIMVMYMGQCVEKAKKNDLFDHPNHPYTKALLDAILIPDISEKNKRSNLIKGEVTSPVNPKPGCRFAPRCLYATEACTAGHVPLKEISPEHYVACTLFQ